MLSPVSSSRCICNFIPNGETSLITCSLSAGRSVAPTKGAHLPPGGLGGTAEFLGFHNPALPELCQSILTPLLPGKLSHEGVSMLSLPAHGHVTARVASTWWHLVWGGFGTFPSGQSQACPACPARDHCGDHPCCFPCCSFGGFIFPDSQT